MRSVLRSCALWGSKRRGFLKTPSLTGACMHTCTTAHARQPLQPRTPCWCLTLVMPMPESMSVMVLLALLGMTLRGGVLGGGECGAAVRIEDALAATTAAAAAATRGWPGPAPDVQLGVVVEHAGVGEAHEPEGRFCGTLGVREQGSPACMHAGACMGLLQVCMRCGCMWVGGRGWVRAGMQQAGVERVESTGRRIRRSRAGAQPPHACAPSPHAPDLVQGIAGVADELLRAGRGGRGEGWARGEGRGGGEALEAASMRRDAGTARAGPRLDARNAPGGTPPCCCRRC